MRPRLIALFAVLLLALSISGIAYAQADPNNPVAHPTATDTDTGGASSPDAEETPTSSIFLPVPKKTPTEAVPTGPDQASPAATEPGEDQAGPAASPVALNPGDDLAAMTLDDSTLPDGWTLTGEQYISVDQLVDGLAGLVSKADLDATGMTGYYESYYANPDGNQVRTYIIAYDSVGGVQKGFDILENEDLLVPNGALQDLPPLAGVGEEPAEITSGTIENGDGTQQKTYDISYRIDRYEVGAAMETGDGSAPDRDLVQQMATDLETRVNAVLAGQDVEGVDPSLPTETLSLDGTVAYEGYESAKEVFFNLDPANLPAAYQGGYYRAYSYSNDVTTYLPLITVGSATFGTANDVDELLLQTDQLMPAYPLLAAVDDFDGGNADNVVAFSFASPGGDGTTVDSVRAFVQVGNQLFTVDVQGETDLATAQKIAEQLVADQLDCLNGGFCTTSLDSSTI